MWLSQLSAFGQTDGYNPSNPPNPSTGESKDTTTYYTLTVASTPAGIGSLNTSGGKYAAGTKVNLYAYSQDACTFVRWTDSKGNTLSESYRLYYTMPASDITIYAEYTYNPDNPGNPETPTIVKKRQLTLVSEPVAGGYFSLQGGSATIEEGKSFSVYAYANPSFEFLYWKNEKGDSIVKSTYLSGTMGSKDQKWQAVFEYRPGNPGNPGSNSWDNASGELIIDDFTAGNAYDAAYNMVNRKGISSSDVLKITLAGKITNSDITIANNYSNCACVDLTRTSGATTVPSWAYSGNEHVSQVYLPASIQTIGYYAFNNCTALTEMVCLAVAPPTLDSYVFSGVPEGLVVYVPEKSVDLYEKADGWKNFIILPYNGNVHSMEVNLPDECKDGRYKNMSLELVNVKSGQKYKYVVTDRINYIYSNLLKHTLYNVYLKNLSGVVLAQIDSVEVEDNNVSVTFDKMKSIYNVTLMVATPEGTDCTGDIDVRWYNDEDVYMAQGKQLTGQAEGSKVRIGITLSQALAMQYMQPADTVYEVTGEDNTVNVCLQPISCAEASGKVIDKATGEPLKGVTVTFAQTLNGKYSKATLARTDAQGEFTAVIFQAPTSVTFSSSEYVSQTIEMAEADMADGKVNVSDVALKPITGVKVALKVTYTMSAETGQTPVVQEGYEDYNNIAYRVYDVTQQREISKVSVQYPNIVLLEEVDENDVISVTASSKKGLFEPVTGEGVVTADNMVEVAIPIVQRGGINASYSMTENRSVVTMVYDAGGVLVDKLVYDERKASLENMAAGTYTLVTMGQSDLFNDFYSLSGLDEAGLVAGTDYVKKEVTVQDGVTATLKNAVVPFFDESKLYYTGDNTIFSVNKSTVVAGNYLTFTAKADFKSIYADKVSDLKLVVDVPQGVSFVNGSVMAASSLVNYTLEDNRLTVPVSMTELQRVRFCVIPAQSGSYAPNAYVAFTLNGKEVMQPIGSANFSVTSLSFDVPSTIGKTTFSANGAAPAKADVEIYDGQLLIGKTTALANGLWNTMCELFEPDNFSQHDLYAKVTTKDGVEMLSETKTLTYNKYVISVNSVQMINTAHGASSLDLLDYVTVFDYQNPSLKQKVYWYWPSYPKFTFLADLTSNDSTLINRVFINVYTSDNTVKQLKATYNAKKDKWIATADFQSHSLPVNVSVTVDDHEFNPGNSVSYQILVDEVLGDVSSKKETVEGGTSTDLIDKDGNFICRVDELEKDGTLADAERDLVDKGFSIEDKSDSTLTGFNSEKKTLIIVIRDGDDKVKELVVQITVEEYKWSAISYICEHLLGTWERKAGEIVKCDENAKYKLYDEGIYVLRHYSLFTVSQYILSKYYLRISDGWVTESRFERMIRTVFYNLFVTSSRKIKTGVKVIKEVYDCTPPPTPTTPSDGPSTYVQDPSGYVYEAVESNRLPGVTASVYYKEIVPDMYGDLHENIVLWNAEEYAQQNPLFTDENGMYQWDVPEGLWQVKLEKEGYQTAYSEWLPVPPPQLEVNIGMVQNSQPEVKSAKAYEGEVDIEFNKYMKPELLTADNVYLKMRTGETEETVSDVTIELTDAEAVSEDNAEQYASKIAIKTNRDLGLADEVYVIVSSRVQSYAGITMAEDYNQKLDVEKKIRTIEVDDNINVGYEQNQSVTVGVLPAEASKGKTLIVKPVSQMIATVSADNASTDDAGHTLVTLDENGQATLTVNGELLGTTALMFSIADAEVTKQAVVNVMEPAKLTQVKEPAASLVNGAAVYRGQTVTLSCETEGASIYYTTDGSAPTDESARIKYDGRPIAVNGDMTIKAMAVGVNGSVSDVKEFAYTIKMTNSAMNFSDGWNWASHNMAASLSAETLKADGINRVLSFDAEIVKDPALGFVGDISDVKADEAIKVEATSAVSVPLAGEMLNPNTTPIDIVKGWNWIGYPLDQTTSVGEALGKLEAEEGDMLSTLDGFAQYNNGEWVGTLHTMTPGKGYMYKAGSSKSFVYSDAAVSKAKALYTQRLNVYECPWTVDIHRYPNMMYIMADVYDGETKAEADKYVIGAFCGDECRGIGQYVKGVLFLSVHGDKPAPVTFVAVDTETGEAYSVKERVDFIEDALGSVAEPYSLHLDGTTGIGDIAAGNKEAKGVTNILGQKLQRVSTQGFYVIDGKKVFINEKNVNEYDK